DGGDGAEWGERGFEVGECVGVEVVVGVRREEGAVDRALLQAGEDGLERWREGVRRGSWGKSGGQKYARDAVTDGGRCARCDLVGEDDDGDAVVREDDVFRDVAADLAGVLELAMAVAVVDEGAETIVRAVAVGEDEGCLEELVAGGREELLLDDADVPGGERGGGHGEVAVAEVPAVAFERENAHGCEGVGDVAGDLEFFALGVRVEDALQLERVENVFADELHERLTADLLHDEAEDDV